MLIGVQGCGKSLAAKAAAGILNVPLLRLDFGALYNKYHGETERNLQRIAAPGRGHEPVRAVDRRDGKGSGHRLRRQRSVAARTRYVPDLDGREKQGSGLYRGDGQRHFGALPPELVRKGRFDEIFFVDLPDLKGTCHESCRFTSENRVDTHPAGV